MSRFFCQFVNPPPKSGHEKDFPDSIVDARGAESIASLVARMVRGEYVPGRAGLVYDGDDPDSITLNPLESVDADLCDISAFTPSQDKPSDTSQDKPLDTSQDKPSDTSQDKPSDTSQDKPSD